MSSAIIKKKLDNELALIFKPVAGTRRAKAKTITYDNLLSDRMLMIDVIKRGVPYSLFDLIRDIAPLTESDWISLLDLSERSLQRYKRSDRNFRPLQSEKIIEIAEVTKAGTDVFGDTGKFSLWLDTPNFALGGLTPKDLLKDSYGKELVMGELTRIDHGILA